MYYIYRITNKLNGKTYVGKHKYKDLSKDEYMGSGKAINKAYLKYGIENFKKEIIISEIETKEEINKLEIEYIKLERESGHGEYNLSDGGDGWNISGINHPLFGKHLSEETKKKLSKSLKGRLIPQEVKDKMSESKRGENHPFYGKHLSEEHRYNLSVSHLAENLSEETRNKLSASTTGENNPFYGKHHTEETKKYLSEVIKAKVTDKYRKARSEAMRGENHTFYGKHLSDSHKTNISNALKGKVRSEETRRKISEDHKARVGKRNYNNGVECHLYYPGTEPEGYILGKLYRHVEDN